ncbi:MAG: hypothetical protein IJ934_03300 [Acetobacter sp.]|nr:hypothetical protein [Acetobacter sp.]
MSNRLVKDISKSVSDLYQQTENLLSCVNRNQAEQLALLDDLRHQIHSSEYKIREDIKNATNKVLTQSLKESFHELTTNYSICLNLLVQQNTLPQSDLEHIEKLARSLISQYETHFKEQATGSPARLPFLIGITFALGAWCGARKILGNDGFAICVEHAKRLLPYVQEEQKTLLQEITLWELYSEGNRVYLLEYYKILFDNLNNIVQQQDQDILLLAEEKPQKELQKTNKHHDDIQRLKNLFKQAIKEPPIDILPIQDKIEDLRKWANLSLLSYEDAQRHHSIDDLRQILGVPSDVPLGSSALELMRLSYILLKDNRRILKNYFLSH